LRAGPSTLADGELKELEVDVSTLRQETTVPSPEKDVLFEHA
jgi:hypothetical protein